jgi:hypothetical protein
VVAPFIPSLIWNGVCPFTAGLRAADANGEQFQPYWESQHVLLAFAPEAHRVRRHAHGSIAAAGAANATEIQLSYKDRTFEPAEVSAPANARRL